MNCFNLIIHQEGKCVIAQDSCIVEIPKDQLTPASDKALKAVFEELKKLDYKEKYTEHRQVNFTT